MSRFRNFSVAASLGVMAAVGLQSAPAHVGAATPRTDQALLVGVLGYEGGAPPGLFHPTSGTVDVAFANPPITLLKHVGSSGHFKIPLAPGSYTVTGCGPSSSGGQGICGRSKNIALSAGEVDHIRLIWAMVP
jgi:hypothetical protein